MTDATLIVTGQHLIIPAEVSEPHETSCLIPNSTYAAPCLSGGLHTYNTRLSDTRTAIAAEFEVALDTVAAGMGSSDPDAIITTDTTLKIAQCSPKRVCGAAVSVRL